jgi:hypothetical protein
MNWIANTRYLTKFGVALLLFTGLLSAGEKNLLHCFYFTPLDGATPADWQAFYKATDELPAKVPGLTHVWVGKLLHPSYAIAGDSDAMAKLHAGGKDVPGKLNLQYREYGVCMEMENAAVLKTYADSAAHKDWLAIYEKVRKPGTSTFDLPGQ